MVATNDFINAMIKDVQNCKHFAKEYWLVATPEARAWIDPNFGWSIDYVMQHLAAFATHYLLPIEKEIRQAKEKGISSQESFTTHSDVVDLLKRLSYEGLEEMIQLGHFAQIELQVAEGYDSEKANFMSIQEELLRILEEARAVNLETLFIPTLLRPETFFTLGDCLQFLIRHQILHFGQAEIIMYTYNQQLVQQESV